jgi:hypothetical protein
MRKAGLCGALFCVGLISAALLTGVAVQSSAAQRDASQATCTAAQKAKRLAALRAFEKHMLARRRAYFRMHASLALRRAFVRRQLALLKRLGAAAACTVEVPEPTETTETTEPTPSPPAPPLTGHYAGVTAQGAEIGLDVDAHAQTEIGIAPAVMRITTSRIDETCTPQRANVIGPILLQQLPFPLSPISVSGFFQVPSNLNVRSDFRYSGHVVGPNAEGKVTWNTTFTDQGAAYTCDSGDVTWKATYTG